MADFPLIFKNDKESFDRFSKSCYEDYKSYMKTYGSSNDIVPLDEFQHEIFPNKEDMREYLFENFDKKEEYLMNYPDIQKMYADNQTIDKNKENPFTKEDFSELVWNYGASGTKIFEDLEVSEAQIKTVDMAWSAAERLMNNYPKYDEDGNYIANENTTEIDELIGTYYKDFVDAKNQSQEKTIVKDPQTKNILLIQSLDSSSGYMTDLFDKNQNFIEHDCFDADSNLEAIETSVSDYAKDNLWGESKDYKVINDENLLETFIQKSKKAALEKEQEEKEKVNMENTEKEPEKISVKEVQDYIENQKPKSRSRWSQAVKEDAVGLLDNFIEWHGKDASFSKDNVKDLLNGAKDWKQYSYGGSGLIYDTDIARHYCTESELKKVGFIDYGNGFYSDVKAPNSNESWLDVQSRALYQASKLIKNSVNEIEQNRKQNKTAEQKQINDLENQKEFLKTTSENFTNSCEKISQNSPELKKAVLNEKLTKDLTSEQLKSIVNNATKQAQAENSNKKVNKNEDSYKTGNGR